jgi:hypothetical protein
MTLAAMLVIGMIAAPSPWLGLAIQTAPQAQSATAPANPSATQDRGTEPDTQDPTPSSRTPPAATTPAKTQQTPPPTAKHHKKNVQPCDNAPAASQTAPGSATTTAEGTATASPPTAGAPKPCAPSKVIVRQGGTSEPSIQIAGGTSGDQTSHQRDAANQILGSADANLKKIAGRPLNSNQQDMVTQIRQFMSQSKAAIDAGDLERARTLAWKAQLLSEELVKPEK